MVKTMKKNPWVSCKFSLKPMVFNGFSHGFKGKLTGNPWFLMVKVPVDRHHPRFWSVESSGPPRPLDPLQLRCRPGARGGRTAPERIAPGWLRLVIHGEIYDLMVKYMENISGFHSEYSINMIYPSGYD